MARLGTTAPARVPLQTAAGFLVYRRGAEVT